MLPAELFHKAGPVDDALPESIEDLLACEPPAVCRIEANPKHPAGPDQLRGHEHFLLLPPADVYRHTQVCVACEYRRGVARLTGMCHIMPGN